MKLRAIVFDNFISETEAKFFREYVKHGIANPSSQVTLNKIRDGESNLTKVERHYFSLCSPFNFHKRVKDLAEKEYDVKLKYRPDAYGHLMHYTGDSEGLEWHNEPNMAYVSASINITPDHMYEGAEFQIKNWDGRTPYKSLILYHSVMTHRVTELLYGEKMSLVMWLPKHDQKVNNKQWKLK
tara:strand:- start:1761 stop:2309 length:549 start_codon:yes stop_codon:yes gene_type:complete